MDETRSAMEMDNMQRESELSQQQQAMDMMTPVPAAPARGRGKRGAPNGPV
jgi:hypothetical protein